MLVNILIGVLIFGYAGWTLFRFVKKSRKGKCAACELNKSCTTACDDLKAESNHREFSVQK
ncbi:FeoB-associated Cys-rich membrane protein [Pseudalkalibacillus caeni]|uniref:FeoB-associated Cys-rich membrane protein n=1 Tax=Exobacillus caeni TaxID=2574798 RepID=A0A5R9F3G6_9BACL|nr:FeoB-associated Cys-rich membrane protein [Pseudalkalibacillus caeni]TLS36930.1 FeoB-associated Cys-rich membrane protein [Pseudalkalibacillus caeni]